MPTHLYGLLALGLGLLVGFSRLPRRVRRVQLARLAALTVGVGLTVAVLYAPALAISGSKALVANPYVARLGAAEFWRRLGPYYLVGTASELLGRGALSAGLFGLAALATPVVLRWGALPASTRRLGWLLYAQLLGWLPVLQCPLFTPRQLHLVPLRQQRDARHYQRQAGQLP